jgi:hypothetical protein
MKYDKSLYGFIAGVMLPFIAFYIFYLAKGNHDNGFIGYLKTMSVFNMASPILSVCVIANLGLFYIMLNRNMYKFSQGIVGATVLYGLFIIYLKFMS